MQSAIASKNNNKLLPCLGQEEAYLFKQKKNVPVYKLNQNLINLMVNSPALELNSDFHKEICNKNFSPSKKLLEYSLLHGKRIFVNAKKDEHQIQYFLSQVPEIFFTHLANIQSGLPNAKCLQQRVPEIGYFLERFKYLQTDLPEESLLKEKDKLRSIFSKINNIADIYKRCKKVTSKE